MSDSGINTLAREHFAGVEVCTGSAPRLTKGTINATNKINLAQNIKRRQDTFFSVIIFRLQHGLSPSLYFGSGIMMQSVSERQLKW